MIKQEEICTEFFQWRADIKYSGVHLRLTITMIGLHTLTRRTSAKMASIKDGKLLIDVWQN